MMPPLCGYCGHRITRGTCPNCELPKDMPELPLFKAPMARTTDPETSHEAAEVIRPKLKKLQALILEAFRKRGPMTARRAERLPSFGAWGFSTIRKRISELHASGHLVRTGVDRSERAPATIYTAADES